MGTRAKRFNGNLHYAKSFLSADELDQRIIDDERSNNRIRRRFINDDGMMDYDSAVGVDDTIPMAQYNSNAQSSATQTPCEDNGAQVFSFRKRESSNTAFGRADTVDATGQLGVPIRQTSSTPPPQAQHEITIAEEEDDRTYFFPLQRQHPKVANSQLDDVDANWDLLGINRPFGSILPALVAWMDGLDLRSPPL
ncbi:hypothetical protein GGI12_004239 [Dipsacomyces acuminosporus]|nr:hypothetical protein GGI12_004239 [Dipsacomyces acuminosporus]